MDEYQESLFDEIDKERLMKLTREEKKKVEEMSRDFVSLSVEAKLMLLRFMMSHEVQVCESVEVSRTMKH